MYNLKLKRLICFGIILVFIFSITLISNAEDTIERSSEDLTDQEENINDHKIYIGTVNGNKIYNCYGKDRYIIIETDGEEKVLEGYQVLATTETQIYTIHFERVFKNIAILDYNGDLIEKYESNYDFITVLNGTSFKYKTEKLKSSMSEETFSNLIRNVNQLVGHFWNEYIIGETTYKDNDKRGVTIDGYLTSVGILQKVVYYEENKEYENFAKIKTRIIADEVFNVHIDGENLYYQKLQDNHKYDENGLKVYNTNLYDINANKILKDFNGKAIVKDGLIAYKEGDSLKIVSAEDPEKILGSAKVDYKIVNLDQMSYGDIIYIQFPDEHIEYVDFNDLLNDANVNIDD